MSTAGGRVRRLLAAVALTLPATGAVLVAAVPQASAAVTAPGNGTVFTSYASFEVVAEHGPSGEGTTLSLTSPGGAPVTVGTAPADRFNGGSIRYRLDLGCWTFPSSDCRGGRLAPNGTWTVQQSGGTSGSSTFVTRIAPQAPTGVSAEAVGAREVRVRWDLGPEPDLVGWALYEGPSVVKDVGLGSCDGGSCSTTVTYGGDAGGTHTYTLRALRSVEPGSSSTLESPDSGSASAMLEQAPSSPPASGGGDSGSDGGSDGGSTGGGTGGGSTGGGTGGSTGGGPGGGSGGGSTGGGTGGTPSAGPGTPSSGPSAPGTPAGGGSPDAPASNPDVVAVEQRKAFALGFTSFGPKLGIPKLPPLPQAPSPEVAPELGDGTFAPTLGFEDQVVTERIEVAGSTSRVRGVVGSALDSEQLARSTAGALVLLLAGAHLRRWLGSASAE